MSMQIAFAAKIPEETRCLVEPLLSADSVYRLVGNEIEQIVSDEDFVDMYADDGRPAVNPVVLALVSVFQFLEELPDRAAAEAAVMRLDWKYALRQELTWTGFHYSDLCNFRKQLLEHEREWVETVGSMSTAPVMKVKVPAKNPQGYHYLLMFPSSFYVQSWLSRTKGQATKGRMVGSERYPAWVRLIRLVVRLIIRIILVIILY